MSAIEVYSPNDANLHLSLPHDHTNSIYSTSPFTYKLDREFDFAEINIPGENQALVALDADTVSSIVWAITRTKQIMNRAMNGRVPAVTAQARIPNYMYQNLGMDRPRLAILLESVSINPLKNIGNREILDRLFRGLQQLGQEAIDWIQEARWRSRLLGERSMWNWDDPRVLRPLAPFIRDPRILANPVTPPRAIEGGTDSSSGRDTPPNSPASAILPFEPADEPVTVNDNEGADLLLQLILHPTASRYAQRYPLFDFFKGETLIDNGYIDEMEDAMDVDSA